MRQPQRWYCLDLCGRRHLPGASQRGRGLGSIRGVAVVRPHDDTSPMGSVPEAGAELAEIDVAVDDASGARLLTAVQVFAVVEGDPLSREAWCALGHPAQRRLGKSHEALGDSGRYEIQHAAFLPPRGCSRLVRARRGTCTTVLQIPRQLNAAEICAMRKVVRTDGMIDRSWPMTHRHGSHARVSLPLTRAASHRAAHWSHARVPQLTSS